MYKATTARFINMGAHGKRQVWTAMANRSRFEQVLAGMLGLLIAIPLMVVILGAGAVLLTLGLILGVVMTIVVWFKRRFGSLRPESGRENVRVVGQSKNPGSNW
jgi:hypothetical protein